MSRIKHVVQIGIIEGNIRLYLEDYVYTYLKREEEEGENKKFYLFGEREKEENWENFYIYGMSDSRQEEKTYFKDFGFLGTLRLREEEKYFTPVSGKERLLDGLLIFYADNQPMQEFLIDRNKDKVREGEQSLRERGIRREDFRFRERPAMPDTPVVNGDTPFPVAGIIASAAVLFLLVSAIVTGNGFEKLQRMKQLVQTTLSYSGEEKEEALVVEEVRVRQAGEEVAADTVPEQTETPPAEETISQNFTAEEISAEEESAAEEVATEESPKAEEVTEEYAEYTVKNGDTLAAICKSKYGSLEKMGEICQINEIKNADHIAPGQKLYLPQ